MADVQKVKILDVNTTKSVKNVKTLKQQIKELRDQLGMLEQGTEEYDRVSKQLADTNQKQIEVNEAMKYSNKDFGATMSNLTRVSAGVIGAFNGVSAAMQMMGADSEEAAEAMKNIQMTMALIQGLSAVDTAIKSLKGLTVAFKDFNTERGRSTTLTAGAAAATGAEATALGVNTKEMNDNNAAAKTYSEMQVENKRLTDESKQAIDQETAALVASKAAREGNTEAAELYMTQLNKMIKTQSQAEAAAADVVNDTLNRELQAAKLHLAGYQQEFETRANRGATPDELNFLGNRVAEAQKKVDLLKQSIEDTALGIQTTLTQVIKDGYTTWDDEVEWMIDDLIKASSESDLGQVYTNLFQEQYKAISDAEKMFRIGYIETEEELAEATERIEEYYETQRNAILKGIETKKTEVIQQKHLEEKILETKTARDAETISENLNADAKLANAGATEKAAVAEGRLGGLIPKTMTGTGALVKIFKGLGSVLKSVVLAFGWVGVALAAVTAGVLIYTNRMKKLHKEEKELADMEAHLHDQYNENNIRLQALVNTAKDNTESVEERKKAIEELNKVVPNYNAKLNEETGAYEANTAALNDYLTNLKEKYRLEAYEGKIKENMQKQVELQEKLNKKIYNGWKGWNEFWGVTRKIRKEIRELDKDTERWFDKIKELDLSKALDENKVTNTTKAAGKTFKELLTEIRSVYSQIWETIFDEKELRKTYNGVYRETDIMFDKIKKIVNSKNLGKDLSDNFKKAIKGGGLEKAVRDNDFIVSLDFIFKPDAVKKMENDLIKLEEQVSKGVSEKGRKYTEKEISLFKERIETLKTELENRRQLADAVQAYGNKLEELKDKQDELNKSNAEYNKQQEIQQRYTEEIRGGSKTAEINREISLTRLQIQTIQQRINKEDEELARLKEEEKQNKKVAEAIKELTEKRNSDQKALNDAVIKLDESRYKKRQILLEEDFAKSEAQFNEWLGQIENYRALMGGGTTDYNMELDLLRLQEVQLNQRKEYIKQYYADLQATVTEGSEKWYLLEQEKNAALGELDRQGAEQRVAIAQAEADRKINIQRTYINTMQTLGNQIQGLLSAQMESYDENSEEYKSLRYANALIDVISGTISAFMSGIESGIPAPYNLGLASLMATIVGTTGAIQLRNLQNETLSTSTATPINIGTHYDTLSYAQNSDILSAIQDQRVYVTESDITSTQRRVRVAETSATF